MTCALSIANQGHEVHLVERSETWGDWHAKYTLPWKDSMFKRICMILLERYIKPLSCLCECDNHGGYRLCWEFRNQGEV